MTAILASENKQLNEQKSEATVSSVHKPCSGALCLATLLQFHKLAANPLQIARQFGGKDGRLDSIDMVRAAKELGLKAKCIKSKGERLAYLALPAIAESKDGEYFIIAQSKNDKVLVQRPHCAPEQLNLSQLDQLWNGHLIACTTRAGVDSIERKFGFTWFIPAIVKYRRLFSEILIASFFIQIFALITPLFFQSIMDKVLVHQGYSTLDVIVVGMVFITIFEVVLGGLRTYVFSHTTSRIDVELGAKLFKHLLALPLNYFQTRSTGQTVARVRELENIRDFLTSSSVTVLLDLLFTVVFIAVMYVYSPTLTFIVLGAIPFYVLLSVTITPVLRNRVEEQFQRGAANQSFLVESITGIETLKAMAVEPQMRERWENQLSGYVKASFRTIVTGTLGSQGVQLISKLVTALVLWFGAAMVMEGELSIGQLIAFNMLSGQVNGPVLRLAQLWQDFQQMRISIARLGDVLNCPTEPGHNPNRATLSDIHGDIRFQDVRFRYGPESREILQGINVDIKAGEVVGFVGRSGSGKSTLTKLLQRLYVPTHGRILVDGVDLAMIDPSWLRRQIGVVLQDNILFNASIKDNIALSNPSLPIEKVIEVAKMAGAHDFILELPQGYDSIIEERGSNLSGGQRQRLAIARALATDPKILIFDEATSALDYESEKLIQKNMGKICKGRTVIIVAHRLSTLRDADRIVVVDQGQVLEQGSHAELMIRNGLYAHLHHQQSK